MKIKWLSNELRAKIKKQFGHHYSCELSDTDVEDIACNLADFVETYSKFRWRLDNDKRI